MSEIKTPQAGEWWETRDGSRAFVGCVRPECEAYDKFDSERLSGWYVFRGSIQTGSWTQAGEWSTGEPCALDLVRHLPGCTGWDWKEPQKPPAKPDPGEGFRLLEPDEKVIQGDEYFEPKGTPRWEKSDNWRYRNGEQSSELVYRRRKEKPQAFVSLDTYEKVVAERNALQDRLREIEAKAKF